MTETIDRLVKDGILDEGESFHAEVALRLAEKGLLLKDKVVSQIRNVTKTLLDAGVLIKDGDTIIISITEPGQLGPSNIAEFLQEHMDEYRQVFAKHSGSKYVGLRPGAMGDPLQLHIKMTSWFKQTRYKYSWEEVLNTARAYVKDCEKQDYRFLQSADYFIMKDGRSRLSSMIDEYGTEPLDLSTNKIRGRHA